MFALDFFNNLLQSHQRIATDSQNCQDHAEMIKDLKMNLSDVQIFSKDVRNGQ